ncbi:cytochrome P450 monooxygenase [Aureobasidium sp. EXF-3400]|nr:cytochrome P450 monooxygenase [Aureobasidium sp. EXF-12344]KAI4778094.1 cytochrome P450 monooxygenase [Aureobasidium sp. EXF-3400]
MAQFSYSNLVWIYLAVTALYISYKVVYRAFFTPLRGIPGPWHAAFVNWRLKIAVLGGRRADYIHELHQKYGPIVRITPNEVAINDPASFKDIHKIGSGFNKTNWYEYLNTNGVGKCPGVFNMTNPKEHAARRKLLAKGFSQRHLREQWEDVVREKVDLAVARIKADATSGTADVLKWWTYLATDVSAHLMFGESFHMLESGERVPYIVALEKATICSAISWELPLVYWIGRRLPFAAMRNIFYANSVLLEQGRLAVKNSKAQEFGTSNIFATAVSEAEKGDGALTDEDIQTEAGNLIVAGSDTTGITLTYLTWCVLKQPALQAALEQEVSNTEASLTDSSLEKLPLLNAVIEETLRLYGAAPATLPRLTPKGGATFKDHFIPAGTIVGTQSYSLHRDPSLFPNPDTFDHTRWLPPNELSPLAKAVFSPFGAGSRVCIGVHLARMELRLAAAKFFRECRGARLGVETTDKSMKPVNFFLITPQAHKCEIVM